MKVRNCLSVVTLLVVIPSFAASLASDNASDSVYNDGWTTGDNGGSGFGAWNLVFSTAGGGGAGAYIGDSTSTVTGNINSGGESFGLYGEGNETLNPGLDEAAAYRSFVGDLSVGQTFSIDLAVNFRNGFKGIDIRNSSDTVIFNFNVGGDDYTIGGGATPSGSIGNSYDANTVFNLSLTQTTGTGGTWSLVRSGGVSDTDSGTYSGVASNVKLYVGNTDVGGPNNLMFNNMAIIPEPGTVTLFGVGLVSLFVSLRRRRNG